MPNLIPAPAECLPTSRRTILAALAGLPLLGALPALAASAQTPDDRIAFALREIESAMAEKYPGWRVQVLHHVARSQRFKNGGFAEGEITHEAALLYVSQEKWGAEEARYFVNHVPKEGTAA
ncbi:hypothetical protein NO932_08615 [Pelagibacterium sp. 26DY04]|uniref:hypothetical protein n=1 Tax=Pelagibacterium sp. 26DY04 TaxID=2967130 RepID=UPI002815A7D5|nr:hypothetical protein [Pelagibacterium sp. 26DY04]WMT88651.1 hypothetical protein NO932_08615 [Pelagibacterium sp. 26DY04]